MNYKKHLTPSALLFTILLGISVVVAVIVNIEVKSAFNMPKLFALRLFTIAVMLVWAYQIWRHGSFSYIKTRFNRYIVTYGIAMLFSTIFSAQIYASIIGIEGRFLGIITMLNFFLLAFLTMNTLTTRKRLIIFISVSLSTAFLLAIYGLMQSVSNSEMYPRLAPIVQKVVGDPAHWTQDPTDRVFGTMGHANHFGAYLAFHIMLLGGLIATAKKWWAKIVLTIAGLVMIAAVTATASRGAMIALSAGIFVFAIFSAKIGWNGIKRWKWLILGAFGAMIIATGIFHGKIWDTAKNSGLGQRTIGTIQFLQSGNIPDRVSWWFSSFEMFADHPILGQGLSTYKDTYNLYRRLDYKVPGDEQDTTTPESTHMGYFNILAEQGIVGFTAYILLITFVLFALAKYAWRGNATTYQYISTSILAALAVYLTQVLMSFGEIATLTYFYMFLGVGMSTVFLAKEAKGEPIPLQTIAFFKKKNLIAGALILFSIIFLNFSWKQYRAEFFYRQAKKAFMAKDAQAAWANYQETINLRPWEYVYYTEFAEDIFAATLDSTDLPTVEQNFQKIFELYEKAIKISGKQPYIRANYGLAYLTLADVYSQLSRPEEATALYERGIEEYQKAIEYGRNNPIYSYTLAQGLLKLSRFESAIEYYEIALKIREPFKDSYFGIAESYFGLGKYDKAREYAEKELSINPESTEATEMRDKLILQVSNKP